MRLLNLVSLHWRLRGERGLIFRSSRVLYFGWSFRSRTARRRPSSIVRSHSFILSYETEDGEYNRIGKGFQGVMKRHNFRGLRASHGVSVSHRSHGSTGQHQVRPSLPSRSLSLINEAIGSGTSFSRKENGRKNGRKASNDAESHGAPSRHAL